MFHTNQNELVAGLRVMQRSHCGYHDPKHPDKDARCDCKYGIAEGRHSEVTGCPELSSAATLIDALRPSEYRALIVRAGVKEGKKFKPSNKVFADERELHLNCPICRRGNVFTDIGTSNRRCQHCKNMLVFLKKKRGRAARLVSAD